MKNNIGRKAWRVDLKWLFGILAVAFLITSLTTFALYRLASNPEAQTLNKNLEKKTSSGFDIKLIDGGSKVKIGDKEYSSEELKKMPEEKMRKIMEEEMKSSGGKGLPNMMMPEKGSKGSPDLDAFNSMDEMPDFIDQAVAPALIEVLNSSARGLFLMVFSTTLMVALLFIVLTIVFSNSWGRLASLGVVLLLSSLPVIIISLMFNLAGALPVGAKENSLSSFAAIFAKSNLSFFLIFGVVSILLVALSSILSLLKRAKLSRA